MPHDWLWWSGIITMGLQLAISGVPFIAYGDWSTLLVTVTGTLLALFGGALPQWRNEKWGNHYDQTGYTFCLTRGNGFQHVVVIRNDPKGCLNLESLALPRRTGCSRSCKAMVAFLALSWILFLVNVCGLQQHTWYLLGVGFMGMIQNAFVAAIPRQPCAMGLPLELVDRVSPKDTKVMKILMETENRFPSVGASLVKTFFPGELRDDEQKWWSARKKLARESTQKLNAKSQQSKSRSRSLVTSLATSGKSSEPISSPQAADSTVLARPWMYTPVIPERRSSV